MLGKLEYGVNDSFPHIYRSLHRALAGIGHEKLLKIKGIAQAKPNLTLMMTPEIALL